MRASALALGRGQALDVSSGRGAIGRLAQAGFEGSAPGDERRSPDYRVANARWRRRCQLTLTRTQERHCAASRGLLIAFKVIEQLNLACDELHIRTCNFCGNYNHRDIHNERELDMRIFNNSRTAAVIIPFVPKVPVYASLPDIPKFRR